ncbi:putative serine protease HhoA precursor [Novipirellula galeiformis]|uniref:Putative serine protease HhoA n=1 Tax=Novipirellula galeiformis TaxID=2528004 RepID=A0A5C6CFT1_9BACT|nr:trypsin-like peptidase domain-containing protein [Novipirellula galeiformis]TWU23490.1 putative serine protease HhoA precursor [Novipirellula galeiformis]
MESVLNPTEALISPAIAPALKIRCLVILALGLVIAASAPIAPLEAQQLFPSPSESSSASVSPNGTLVSVPSPLQPLLRKGGIPSSLDQMQLLEKQQQRVAAQAKNCTVSVQIGAAQGCGVIITESGYILTAAHVAMRPKKNAVIKLQDGRTVTATTYGMNRSVDAGLIKINDGQNEGRPWQHATLGTSEHLVPGMWCIATGHPGGYDRERGPVTRVGRILTVRPDAIVTDCALIGGDSGGPLFDIEGRLIAVHSRIGNDVADNLHIPVDHYDFSWKRLAASEAWGVLPGFRPVLGVRGNQTEEVARVLEVNKGSPAEDAGIQVNDIVERFGEMTVTDFASLSKAVSDTMPGERVEIWVNRQDQRIRVVVEIGRAD